MGQCQHAAEEEDEEGHEEDQQDMHGWWWKKHEWSRSTFPWDLAQMFDGKARSPFSCVAFQRWEHDEGFAG